MAAAISRPIMVNGQFLGTLLFDINMGGFQSDLQGISSADQFYALFSQSGLIVAHGLSTDLVMKNIFELMGMKAEDVAKGTAENPFAQEKVSPSSRQKCTTNNFLAYTQTKKNTTFTFTAMVEKVNVV